MASQDSSQSVQQVQTAGDLVSLGAFHAIVWISVSVCTILCAGRVYIRYVCFKRLLIDDWLMVLAWAILLSVAALGQVYLKNIYLLMAVATGRKAPDATFIVDAQRALRAFGAAMLLSYVGIWTIKLNFLIFFKRLGQQLTMYTIFWWIVTAITMACGITCIGLVQYRCLFGPIMHIIIKCAETSSVRQTYDFFKVSCIVDVISDVLIICFPIVILWKVRISRKKKFALCAIFSLVSFTIAVTIVRGSIFGGTYKSISENKRMQLNVTWIWFWFFIEFSVSFIIACLVSFKALFTHRQRESDKEYREMLRAQTENASDPSSSRKNVSLTRRARRFHDSVLESFRDTETIDDDTLPMPASGRFSAAFISNIADDYAPKETVYHMNAVTK